MKKMILFAVSVLVFGALVAQAEVSIIQDYCEEAVPGQPGELVINFSIVNFGLQDDLCAVILEPEPQPPLVDCEVVGVIPPAGFTGYGNPMGGADFFASDPGSCIAGGTMMQDFKIIVGEHDFCCYVVSFLDAAGMVMHQQEECFNCTVVEADDSDWGSVKGFYR